MGSKLSDELDDREDIINDSGEEDEDVQDWSQVSQIAATSITLPRRGEKDYEPDGSDIQELQLYKAKKLMLDTLRNSVRGSVLKSQVKAYYYADKHQALLPLPKGNFLTTMGRANSSGEIWLDFHEFVYLSERGTITPFWGHDLTDVHEIPLSVEDLYSFFPNQNELNKYLVYSHLKRLGFIVTLSHDKRTHTTSFFPRTAKENRFIALFRHNPVLSSISSIFKLKIHFYQNYFVYSRAQYIFGRYTTNEQIYKRLANLVSVNPILKSSRELLHSKHHNYCLHTGPGTEIVFDMWKPCVNFRKKSPGLPDYQIVIFDKNNPLSKFPSSLKLKSIFNQLDYKFDYLGIDDDEWDEHSYTEGFQRMKYLAMQRNKTKIPIKDKTKNNHKQVSSKRKKRPVNENALKMKRLKQGYRSFLMAVIDNGLISFIRISETDFNC
ncbi:tRNA-splicing endonuclease subunit SEN54 [Nakaseomyces bracarensis]|uniref:tRNA-splicing endonuclease subunit SEN54 n=1 Tax=Nakaseomyces bracarensis TaxID=273131 RepID=A0ABR4NY79_9SACH